jgi:hypothetical protein
MLRLVPRLSPLSFSLSLLALALVPAACVDSNPVDEAAGESDADATGDESGEELRYATWHQDIAPIVTHKCSGCHRDGGIGPFALETYEQGAAWAELSVQAIETGAMPPWGQDNTEECEPRHGFKDDPRLTDDELDLVHAWIDSGKPEGDPTTAAPVPAPPELTLDDADLRLTTSPIEITPGKDQFWCFVLDPGFEQSVFIDASQIVAGNESIVHHVLLYIDETGAAAAKAGDDGRYPCFGGPGLSQPTLISAWAPGVPPAVLPPEIAMQIPAGAKLVMNVHYHPTGDVQVDPGTSVDFRYVTGAPQYFGQLLLMGNFSGPLGGGMGLQPGPNDSTDTPEFRIPAGAVGHTETMLFRLPPDIPELRLWSAGTHMHYVGTDMLLGLQRSEPEAGTGVTAECLIQTPHYNFEWQRGYSYDAAFDDLPTARGGDILYMRCTYDNSLGNPHVAAALAEQGLSEPVDVYLGEETLDEMCLGVYGIAYSLF